MTAKIHSYLMRPANPGDEAFLWEMLYHAIFVADGAEPLPRTVVAEPHLARYVAGWGKDGDEGVLVMVEGTQEPVGAAWFRCFPATSPGYGFVDNATPELSVAVLPAHRGLGLGTQMLQELIQIAATRFKQISLSCDPANPAWRLYQRLGFEPIGETRTMIMPLQSRSSRH